MELKPCPFCGGRAAVLQNGDFLFAGRCFKCGAHGKSIEYKYVNSLETAYDKAAEAWNRRADND